MAQDARAKKLQIYTAPSSTVLNGTYVDMLCQAPEARTITIQNRDGSIALNLATDTAGNGITVPANGSITFQLTQEIDLGPTSWVAGDYILSIKAAGAISTQPTIIYQM